MQVRIRHGSDLTSMCAMPIINVSLYIIHFLCAQQHLWWLQLWLTAIDAHRPSVWTCAYILSVPSHVPVQPESCCHCWVYCQSMRLQCATHKHIQCATHKHIHCLSSLKEMEIPAVQSTGRWTPTMWNVSSIILQGHQQCQSAKEEKVRRERQWFWSLLCCASHIVHGAHAAIAFRMLRHIMRRHEQSAYENPGSLPLSSNPRLFKRWRPAKLCCTWLLTSTLQAHSFEIQAALP